MTPFFTTHWPISGLAVANNSMVVVGAQVLVLDLDTQEQRTELALCSGDVDIDATGELIALTLRGGDVALVRLDCGEIVNKANDYRGRQGPWVQFNRVRFSPSGRFLASDCDNALVVWNTTDLTVAYRLDEKHEITALDWLPDESGIVFGTKQHLGIFWIKDPNKSVTRIHTGSVGDVCVLGQSERIVVGAATGHTDILIVDYALQTKGTLAQQHVFRLRASSDEKLIYAGSYPAFATGLWRWDLRRRRGSGIQADDGDTICAIATNASSGDVFAAGTAQQIHRFSQHSSK